MEEIAIGNTEGGDSPKERKNFNYQILKPMMASTNSCQWFRRKLVVGAGCVFFFFNLFSISGIIRN